MSTGLVVTTYGMIQLFNASLRGVSFSQRYGLFGNDWEPRQDSTISEPEPTIWAGYAGLLPIMSWTPPTLFGFLARGEGTPLIWTRTVGVGGTGVFGYYAVDGTGQLIWAERQNEYPTILNVPGDTYAVIPAFSVGSRF